MYKIEENKGFFFRIMVVSFQMTLVCSIKLFKIPLFHKSFYKGKHLNGSQVTTNTILSLVH